jgi:hypothetical protein
MGELRGAFVVQTVWAVGVIRIYGIQWYRRTTSSRKNPWYLDGYGDALLSKRLKNVLV